MSDEKKVDVEAPKTQVVEKTDSVTKTKKSGFPIILVVIILILCCCCASIIGGGIFLYQRAQSMGYRDWADIIQNSGAIINNNGSSGLPIPPFVSPNGDSGSSTGGGYLDDIPSGTIPAGFPSDVPIYPNAKVVFGTRDEETGFVVSLAANASASTVSAFYKTELAKKGWTITSEQTFLGDLITAEKGSSELTVIVYDASDAGIDQLASSITLSVTPRN